GCIERVVTDCGLGTCDETTGSPMCTVAGEFYVGVNTVFETEPMFFTQIDDNAEIPVTQGFQGTWMVVVAFKTRALLSGNLSIDASIELDGMPAGSLSLDQQVPLPGNDGYDYYYNYFVDMGLFEPPMMGLPLTIHLTVSDDLGVMVDETRVGTVGEHIFL